MREEDAFRAMSPVMNMRVDSAQRPIIPSRSKPSLSRRVSIDRSPGAGHGRLEVGGEILARGGPRAAADLEAILHL